MQFQYIATIFIMTALICGLSYLMFTGSHGVFAVWALQKRYTCVQKETELLEDQLRLLLEDEEELMCEPFLTEQTAREKLQMTRVDDTVYFIVENSK